MLAASLELEVGAVPGGIEADTGVTGEPPQLVSAIDAKNRARVRAASAADRRKLGDIRFTMTPKNQRREITEGPKWDSTISQ